MNNIPKWGCPIHGLVKGSRVTLANGSQMQVPQPFGLTPMLSGKCTPVRMPFGNGDDSSEPDENGHHLRRTALLASGHLHGKRIPPGAWIYHDSNGANWLVTTTLHGSQGGSSSAVTRSMTLKRFGVFGPLDESQQNSVTLTFETPAIDVPEGWGLRSHMYLQAASSLTGDKACFGIYQNNDDQSSTTFGFIQIALSGAGESPTVTITVEKTYEQAQGVRGPVETIPLMHYTIGSPVVDVISKQSNCSGADISESLYRYNVSGANMTHLAMYALPAGSYHADNTVTDIPMGVFYNQSGELDYIYIRCRIITEASSSTSAENHRGRYERQYTMVGNECTSVVIENTPATFNFALDQSVIYRTGVDIKIGSSGSYQEVASHTEEHHNSGSYAVSRPVGRDLSGEDKVESGSYNASFDGETVTSGSTLRLFSIRTYFITEQDGKPVIGRQLPKYTMRVESFMLSQYFEMDLTTSRIYIFIAPHSPSLVGMYYRSYVTGSDVYTIKWTDSVVSPAGMVSTPEVSVVHPTRQSTPTLYGAWNPITNEVERHNLPVNFM